MHRTNIYTDGDISMFKASLELFFELNLQLNLIAFYFSSECSFHSFFGAVPHLATPLLKYLMACNCYY